MVRWLLDQGFSHSEIRYALSEVRDDYPDWPLLNAPLGVGQQTVGDRRTTIPPTRGTPGYLRSLDPSLLAFFGGSPSAWALSYWASITSRLKWVMPSLTSKLAELQALIQAEPLALYSAV